MPSTLEWMMQEGLMLRRIVTLMGAAPFLSAPQKPGFVVFSPLVTLVHLDHPFRFYLGPAVWLWA